MNRSQVWDRHLRRGLVVCQCPALGQTGSMLGARFRSLYPPQSTASVDIAWFVRPTCRVLTWTSRDWEMGWPLRRRQECMRQQEFTCFDKTGFPGFGATDLLAAYYGPFVCLIQYTPPPGVPQNRSSDALGTIKRAVT